MKPITTRILNFFWKTPVLEPIPSKPPELLLFESQLEAASQAHAEWATKYYLQLIVDGLPVVTAAKQASFKFFGSYQ